MSYLIDKKNEHETKCEAAIREGRGADAVFHAAKAAEFSLALAGQTGGKVAERYVANAEGWLEIAEKLKAAPPKKKKPSGPAVRDQGDEAGAEDSWLVVEKPAVSFDMIFGMEEAKKTIFEMVIFPLKQPEKTRALGLRAGGGVLLFGPPGNGKTTLGKAIAHELDAKFYYASGAQIRSKWHGESEQRLRQLIQAARKNPVSVLFFDDVDGLLPRRGGSSVVDNRIVVQFLSEIGGFEESENILLMLGATNVPWNIDEAVFRTGRFDEKIFIGLPDEAARLGMLRFHLEKVPKEEEIDLEYWAKRLEGYTGSDIVGVVNAAKRAGLSRAVKDDTEPLLLKADLEGAFANIPSSATPALMARYKKFMEARF